MRQFDRTLSRLERQIKAAQDTRGIVAKMGEKLLARLQEGTPRDTGHMASVFLRSTEGPRWLPLGSDHPGGAMVFSIGNVRRVGNQVRAPRGTIKAFLRDHPEFRLKRNLLNQLGGKSTWTGHWQPRQAWWRLSRNAKRVLQQERLAGKYGGAGNGIGSDKAAYLYPQSGDRPEWEASAAAAGITPSYFLEAARVDFRTQDLPGLLRDYAAQVRNA